MATQRSLSEILRDKTSLYFFRTSGSVCLRGRNVIIHPGQPNEVAVPLVKIRRVVIVGKAEIEPALFYRFMRLGINVDWLDIFGKPLAQLAPFSGMTEAHLERQLEFRKKAAALELFRAIILAKVDNCHEILRRRTAIPPAWKDRRQAIMDAASAESLRGAEGMAAKEYFGCWRGILHEFSWDARKYHPAPDPINMVLSLGYAMLRNHLASALRNAGLNPRQGFFHAGRGSHDALASDLMEPLRACIDTAALTLVRHQEIKQQDFKHKGDRCVCNDNITFVKLLTAFEEAFARERVFYVDPADNSVQAKRSLYDCLDDLAESFAAQILNEGGRCIIPRLAPCPHT